MPVCRLVFPGQVVFKSPDLSELTIKLATGSEYPEINYALIRNENTWNDKMFFGNGLTNENKKPDKLVNIIIKRRLYRHLVS